MLSLETIAYSQSFFYSNFEITIKVTQHFCFTFSCFQGRNSGFLKSPIISVHYSNSTQFCWWYTFVNSFIYFVIVIKREHEWKTDWGSQAGRKRASFNNRAEAQKSKINQFKSTDVTTDWDSQRKNMSPRSSLSGQCSGSARRADHCNVTKPLHAWQHYDITCQRRGGPTVIRSIINEAFCLPPILVQHVNSVWTNAPTLLSICIRVSSVPPLCICVGCLALSRFSVLNVPFCVFFSICVI